MHRIKGNSNKLMKNLANFSLHTCDSLRAPAKNHSRWSKYQHTLHLSEPDDQMLYDDANEVSHA